MGSGKALTESASEASVAVVGATLDQAIYLIRGQRVMLDSDLASPYGVETSNLNKAVKRNLERFPKDFMFQITESEWAVLRSQNGISSGGNLTFQNGISKGNHGGRRTLPYVFTQEGVAMLSGVLRSERAIKVNIEIMRAFVRFRHILASNQELINRLDSLEQRYDKNFAVVFDAIQQILAIPPTTQPIGFQLPTKK